METVILVGGKGTRMGDKAASYPKCLATIGGKPIVRHIMDLYAKHKHTEFVLATGFKHSRVKSYFKTHKTPYRVEVVHTGIDTQTGGRLKKFEPDGTFMATYGDGLGNVDITRLLAFHKKHGKLATVTAVRPPARFGHLELDGDRVAEFSEKPSTKEGWISGGFFVLEPEVLDFIEGDQTAFEREPLANLAACGQLMAFKHEGFWQPMDTQRERDLLQGLWDSGSPPWL